MSANPTSGPNPSNASNQAAAVRADGDPANVRLDGVSIFYGEVVGLSQVSLELTPGITGIVGPNGSGKTTLMRSVIGLIPPREGTVRVLGADPFLDAGVRSRIAFVPATENFHPGLSGRKNLEIAFLARGHSRSEAKRLADEGLEIIGLTQDGRRAFGAWSRGMRQRLKLALALVGDARVVMLDEPFLGVDPPSRHAVRQHILALAAKGCVVLVSSHVLHEIESLTDRVGVLASGRMLGFGRVDRILQDIQADHPHRVSLHVDRPRALGPHLLGLEHVTELRITGETELEFVTERPDDAYAQLAALVVAADVSVQRVETLEHSLEAVFEHVSEAGTRRL